MLFTLQNICFSFFFVQNKVTKVEKSRWNLLLNMVNGMQHIFWQDQEARVCFAKYFRKNFNVFATNRYLTHSTYFRLKQCDEVGHSSSKGLTSWQDTVFFKECKDMFGIEDLKRNAANEKYRLCKYVAFGSEDKWYNDSRMAKYADR